MMRGSHLSTQAVLVNIPLAIEDVVRSEHQIPPRQVSINRMVYFGHDDDLIPREVVLFDGFAEDDLRLAIAIRIRGVESVDSQIISAFDMFDALRTPCDQDLVDVRL